MYFKTVSSGIQVSDKQYNQYNCVCPDVFYFCHVLAQTSVNMIFECRSTFMNPSNKSAQEIKAVSV